MSDKKLTFHEKMSNFFIQMGIIKKDKKNPYYNSLYVDVNSILINIKEPLSDNNLRLSERKIFDKELNCWLIHLKVIDIDSPNDFEETFSPIITRDKTDPQKHIAATTYARRDALVTLLNLPQEDDDGNTAAGKGQNYPEPEKRQVKTKKMTPRQQFLEFIAKEGIDAKHLNDFTNWMITAGYDIKNDDVKISLLNQDIKLKKLIRAYLDALQTQ